MPTVDEHTISPAGDPFTSAPRSDHDETPHACLEGWVYLGFETEEDGELVEIYDRVRCRRCAPVR
jgi:hypothetical protein